ncbi:MAG: hypothetical protein E7378_04005 [Clostridiales bacterium]|nr:hypothetical protein [Clostridiales bacterium]
MQSIKDITNTFIFMPQDQILEFFCNLANTKHKAKIIDNFVVIGEKSFTILSPHFNNDGLNCDKLIETYNQISKMFAQNIEFNNIKKIIICTNKNKENVDFVVDNFCLSTIILDAKQTYLQLLKAYEFYPKITVQEKPKAKNTFKKLLAIAFDKKRTKSYVLSALFMFFASFFVFYKIYYLIVATLLLSFAILCQTNLPFNKVEKEKLIE